MEKKSKQISFRANSRIFAKLKRYMEAVPGMETTEAIISALDCGIDTLESIGWDVGRDAARRRVESSTKPLECLPTQSGNLSKRAK